MRRKEKEVHDTKLIDDIFSNSNVCRIAFNDNEYPYIVAMNYGKKDNYLYFHCATSGKKLDLIKKNNKVGFEIEEEHEIIKDKVSCNWTTKYKSIIGFGEIEIITDLELKKEGLDILMQHHGKYDNSYSENAINKIVILRLQINHFTAKQSV